MCFLPRKFFPLALCCSLDRLARGDFLLPRMELNEPPCLLAIPSPELCFCYLWLIAVSLHPCRPIPRAVWPCFNRRLSRIFADIFLSRARRGENNNIAFATQYIVFSVALWIGSVFISLSPISATRILYLANTQRAGGVFFTFYITIILLL